MAIITMPIKPPRVVSHVVRADLVPLAALYYVHVAPDEEKAQSLMAAFCAQGRTSAAIRLTTAQYQAFETATRQIHENLRTIYEAYKKETEALKRKHE